MLCTAVGKGREHDFNLFKRSQVRFKPKTKARADRGYQGIQHQHSNSQTPIRKLAKKTNKTLSSQQKAYNREWASKRMAIEHIVGKLKVFRILSERYRNRRRRFGRRLNLIAALYNLDLDAR